MGRHGLRKNDFLVWARFGLIVSSVEHSHQEAYVLPHYLLVYRFGIEKWIVALESKPAMVALSSKGLRIVDFDYLRRIGVLSDAQHRYEEICPYPSLIFA